MYSINMLVERVRNMTRRVHQTLRCHHLATPTLTHDPLVAASTHLSAFTSECGAAFHTWSRTHPARASGAMGLPADALLTVAGILAANPALTATGVFALLSDCALLRYADPKKERDIEEPQDTAPGMRRLYDAKNYPHEFAMIYLKMSIACLIASGVQVTGEEIRTLEFLNYVDQTHATYIDIDIGERTIGLDGKTFSGLLMFPGMIFSALVPEKSAAQIAERQLKRQPLEWPARGVSGGGINALKSAFHGSCDYAQQNVPFITGNSWQIALIPYAQNALSQPTLSQQVTMGGSAILFAAINHYYSMSNKRAQPVCKTARPYARPE